MKKKLAAVDYVGTALTLGGCTLVILPLIWVCLTSSFSIVYIPRLLLFSRLIVDFGAIPCRVVSHTRGSPLSCSRR